MSEGLDPLQQLWQQQEVSVPSQKTLKANWRKEKRKHYWYVGLDALALLSGPVMLYLMKHRMHWFEIIWLVFIIFVATLYTGYIVWLRRLAFTRRGATTTDYLSLLKKQYEQNIKIAISTKYSTFVLPPLFLIMFIGAYFLEIFEPERLLRKLAVACGVFAISLPPLWYWADRRAKRFKRELALLSQNVPVI